jgi:ribonuclease HII
VEVLLKVEGPANNGTIIPDLTVEKSLFAKGFQFIAGVDEVGRGALAGPVVAAAVILPKRDRFLRLKQVRDSKELTKARRERLYQVIKGVAIAVEVGIISSQVIDNVNIYNATKLAMEQAINRLKPAPEFILIDAMSISRIKIPQKAIIKGDKTCFSIACASIIAKVTRDQIMSDMDTSYPDYGFCRNMGYGTKQHMAGLKKVGPSDVHRYSFSPVRESIRFI